MEYETWGWQQAYREGLVCGNFICASVKNLKIMSGIGITTSLNKYNTTQQLKNYHEVVLQYFMTQRLLLT